MNKNRLLKLEKRFNKKTPNEFPIFAFTEGDKIVLHKVFFDCLGLDTKDYEPCQVTGDFTENSFLPDLKLNPLLATKSPMKGAC